MPIRSKINLFAGINPILNNFLQFETGWKGFHSLHLADIARQIDQQLPEMYYTASEESLQIGVYDNPNDHTANQSSRTTPDITIYSTSRTQTDYFRSYELSNDVLTIPLTETLAEKEEYLLSVVIYKLEDDTLPGTPITRIELLSPANKFPGSHYASYINKRLQTLESGLRLIEIDYLHSRRPIIRQVKPYPQSHDAKPYHVYINDPRPSVADGRAYVVSFGVMDAIPSLPIPLEADDLIFLDLGTLYNQTLTSTRLYYQQLIDYQHEPIHMESFTAADQQAIRDKLRQIAQEQA